MCATIPLPVTAPLPTFGATHLNHIHDNAFDARCRGLPKSNLSAIEADFSAYRAYELGWYRTFHAEDALALADELTALQEIQNQGRPTLAQTLRLAVVRELLGLHSQIRQARELVAPIDQAFSKLDSVLDASGALDSEPTQRAVYEMRLAIVRALGDEDRLHAAQESLADLSPRDGF